MNELERFDAAFPQTRGHGKHGWEDYASKRWWEYHHVTYLLLFRDKTVYFGSTQDIRARISGHKGIWNEPFKHKVLCVGSLKYVRALERRLIRMFAATGRLRNKVTYQPKERKSNSKGFRNGSSIRNRLRLSGSTESYSAVLGRMKNGETFEQAIQPGNRWVHSWVEFEGRQWGANELAAHLGMSWQALDYRLKRGIKLTQPKNPGRRL